LYLFSSPEAVKNLGSCVLISMYTPELGAEISGSAEGEGEGVGPIGLHGSFGELLPLITGQPINLSVGSSFV
jgi:hypothetical protein